MDDIFKFDSLIPQKYSIWAELFYSKDDRILSDLLHNLEIDSYWSLKVATKRNQVDDTPFAILKIPLLQFLYCIE